MSSLKLMQILLGFAFTIGVSWTTVKLTMKFIERRLKSLETWRDKVDKAESDKVDRLARIETKLDLLITGKINNN